MPLRLIFRLVRKADGTLGGSILSIDQGPGELAADRATLDGKTLRLDLKAIGAEFEGTFNDGNSELSGQWRQGEEK